MENRYSLDAFFEFLRFIVQKNLIGKSNGINWSGAAQKFKDLIIEGGHQEDLRNIDLSQLIVRFDHKYSRELTASSLKIYASRIRSALKNFFDYATNPSGYKATPSLRGKDKVRLEEKKKSLVDRASIKNTEDLSSSNGISVAEVSLAALILPLVPIPLRKGVIVQVIGLPNDLPIKEAEKIGAILRDYYTIGDQ